MSSGGGFTRGDPMAMIADLRRQVEALQRRLTEAQPGQPRRSASPSLLEATGNDTEIPDSPTAFWTALGVDIVKTATGAFAGFAAEDAAGPGGGPATSLTMPGTAADIYIAHCIVTGTAWAPAELTARWYPVGGGVIPGGEPAYPVSGYGGFGVSSTAEGIGAPIMAVLRGGSTYRVQINLHYTGALPAFPAAARPNLIITSLAVSP